MDTRPLTIIAVHGVGDATPGAILADLSISLTELRPGADPSPKFERQDLLVSGQFYPRLEVQNARLGNDEIAEIIEVNWADVLRPESRPFSILKHLVMLLIGMRNVSSTSRIDGSGAAEGLRKAYWWTIENVAMWAALLCMNVMLLFSSKEGSWRTRMIAIGALAIVGGIAWLFQKGVRSYRSGFYWLVPFTWAGLAFSCPNARWGGSEFWVQLSTRVYSGSQYAVFGLLVLAAAASLLLDRDSWQRRLAVAGFLWIPMTIFTMLFTALWASLLAWGAGFEVDRFAQWQALFIGQTGYHLYWSEVIMAAAMIGMYVVVPIVAVVAYRYPRAFGFPGEPGKCAHQMISVFLSAGPCFLLAAMVGCLLVSLLIPPYPPNDHSVLEVYALSSTRAIAFLGLLVPAFRVILDAAGDVLFHIQPGDARQSTRRRTGDRVKQLLDSLNARPNPPRVMLMAHSQGSVISAELLGLGAQNVEYLVTLGSPICSLYSRFLYDLKPITGNFRWINLYRSGDYIGGEISGHRKYNPPALVDLNIGPGGHMNYWAMQDFMGALDQKLKVPASQTSCHVAAC